MKRFFAVLGGATLRPEPAMPPLNAATGPVKSPKTKKPKRKSVEAPAPEVATTPFNDPRMTSGQFIGVAVLWTIYLILVFGIVRDQGGDTPLLLRAVISPVLVPVVWFGVYRWRTTVSGWLAASSAPGWLLFFGVGLLFSMVTVGSTVGFGVLTDAAPQVPRAASILVYIGPWFGLVLVTWLVRRWWALDVHHVFWTLGLAGAASAGGGILLVALTVGDVVGAVLLTIYLVPAYGVGLAAAVAVMPASKFPMGKRRLTRRALLTLGCLSWVLFSLLAWGWIALLEAMF